jgi:hypothetical protein
VSALSFWPRRLRWRLLGAWRWPLFFALTIADGFIAHALPPTGARAGVIPAMIICSFANLFLIGLVAPWLARRLSARQGLSAAHSRFPPEDHTDLLTDRISTIALLLATLGLVVAGLGNKKFVDAITHRVERGGDAAKAFAISHGPPEIGRAAAEDNINTHPLQEDGFFRMCVPYVDARKQFCMYVDANHQPPVVRRDPDTRPNQVVFPESPAGGGF